MSDIILVAETGSDIPQETAERYGIYLVPMHVSFESEDLADGSFPPEKICSFYSKTGKIPKTSAASPSGFAEVFDEIHARWPHKQILYLAYSAVTTSSYQNALFAAAGRDYVTSVDTRQVSGGQGAIVIKLAQALEANPEMTTKEAAELAERLSTQTRMCFFPNALEYLRAGGRVSNVAYLGSKLLNIHPRIEVLDGILLVTKKYRGALKNIAARIIREYSQEHGLCKELLYLLWSVGLDEEVKRAAEDEAKSCGFMKVVWLRAGCVITTHAGPGSLGMVGFSLN